MKKAHISFLHNLEHLEFKIFYSNLIELIQKYHFVDPTLTDLLERLLRQNEDVDNLKSSVQKYKNTTKTSELSKLRSII